MDSLTPRKLMLYRHENGLYLIVSVDPFVQYRLYKEGEQVLTSTKWFERVGDDVEDLGDLSELFQLVYKHYMGDK